MTTKATTPKPRPCPFCGKEPNVLFVDIAGRWYIECCRTGHHTAYASGDTLQQAITNWNGSVR